MARSRFPDEAASKAAPKAALKPLPGKAAPGKPVSKPASKPAPKPAPKPVPVKRKRVVDTDHGSEDDCPTKKPKPSTPSTVVAVPLPAIIPSIPRSFGPRSSGKCQTKQKIAASDVPARRTRSKVTDEQPKGIQTRKTRK